MFDQLTDKFDAVFSKLRKQGRLRETDIEEALREVRMVLLEADVNFQVVKDFTAAVRERALGQEVLKSLTPAQQVIKVVRDELSRTMGSDAEQELDLAAAPPVPVMLCGLQGAGKTTTCAKLGLYLQEQKKRKPLLVPADVTRPAAIEQLQTLGQQYGLAVYDTEAGKDVVKICQEAQKQAYNQDYDTLILDTAGRLHIDTELMAELKRLEQKLQPRETLLVADAMTGQDAVNVATSFAEGLSLSGVILTKMDGDARGGAAVSLRAVTGKPIKFVGMGEKADALEPFYPDRMAQRILGMGDVLSLIEKAEQAVDADSAADMEAKLKEEGFTLDTFREQLRSMKKMGSMEGLMKMVPGMGKAMKQLKGQQLPEKELKKIEAMIDSMTQEERRNHKIINGSRRLRIARGSGTKVQDVNQLLKRFKEMQKMMKKVQGMNPRDLKNMLGKGGFPGGMPM